MEQHSTFDSFELHISPAAQGYLRETAKWAMFISIIGFIIVAFSLLGAFGLMAMGNMIDSAAGAAAGNPMAGAFSGVMFGVITLIFTILWAIPIFYLYKFSSDTKQAIANNNTDSLTRAFQNLRSHYRFIGIMVIVSIISYIAWIIYFMSLVANTMNR